MKKLSVLLAAHINRGMQLTAQQDNRAVSLSVFSPFKKRGIVSISQLMNNICVIKNTTIAKVFSAAVALPLVDALNACEEPLSGMHHSKQLQKIFQLN